MTNTNDNSNVVAITYWKQYLSYKPLINYKWNTDEIDETGVRYLTDSGAYPKFPAHLYFNRSMLLNGVDQTVTIPINAQVQTIYTMIDGVDNFNETTQTLGDYVISAGGIHSNYIFYDGIFTDSQKAYLASYPEKFLYRHPTGELNSDGEPLYELKSNLDTLDISKVTTYLPMCETGSDIVDLVTMISYPIAGFTNAVRDNAINGDKGLQTCFLKRDDLGVPYASSFDRQECDSVGYATNEWVPSGTFQIEEVVEIDGEPYHTVYDEQGRVFRSGEYFGDYTIPTSIVLDNKTIDGIALQTRRLWRVHTEYKNEEELFLSAISSGYMCEDYLVDADGKIVIDADGFCIQVTEE